VGFLLEHFIIYLLSLQVVLQSTPPSTPGEYVTRVGEAGNTTQLAIKPELPILLA